MLEVFFPKFRAKRIQDIDLDQLLKRNIKGLILDIDNTLVPQHMPDADENAVKWIERVRAAGIKACIVSNASKKRVIRFNERLKLQAIHRANKPSKKAYLKAKDLMGIEISETAVIGDQIFTDIWGGNKLDMFTILVNPIDKNEAIWVRIKRFPEKFILYCYGKQNKTGR